MEGLDRAGESRHFYPEEREVRELVRDKIAKEMIKRNRGELKKAPDKKLNS